MPASPPILALGVIGALLVFFLAWRRPVVALTVWLIFSTAFSFGPTSDLSSEVLNPASDFPPAIVTFTVPDCPL